MNTEDDYFDGDMSDGEYRQRIRREQEREEYYANVRKTETSRRNDDTSPYRFSSDDDDMNLSY